MDFLQFNSESMEENKFGVEICFSHFNMGDKYLPRLLTGNGVRYSFLEIPTGQTLNNILFRGTHWYKSLWVGRKPKITVKRILSIATVSVNASLPIESYLQMACSKKGLAKLRNAFVNCDGVISSILGFSSGRECQLNSWIYMDRVMSYLVHNFVNDVVFEKDETYKSFYERIKDVRGTIKRKLTGESPLTASDVDGIFFYVDMLPILNEPIETRRAVQDLAVLTQKRAIGLPTPMMRLKAYKKYYETCTKPEAELKPYERHLVDYGCEMLWNVLEEKEDFLEIIARCQRNEKVSISSSADLLSTKEEGGKLRSANLIVNEALPQMLFNLETGEPTGEIITRGDLTAGKSTIGTILLHRAVQAWKGSVSGCPLSALLSVKPVAVADQGKYRIATASHPLHSFLLQPFAQLAKSALLQFESTKAGMEKQYHMWEFYKRIKPHMVQDVKLEEKLLDRENFIYCSDWSMASDNLSRESVRILLTSMVKALGVPKFYGSLCVMALTAPRVNVLNPTEEIPPDICPAQFVSKTGVLQGDPVTKNVMQLMHIVCRFAAMRVLDDLAESSPIYAPSSVKAGETHRAVTHWPIGPEKRVWGALPVRKASHATTPVDTSGSVNFLFSLLSKRFTEEEKFHEKVVEFLIEQRRPKPKGIDLRELSLLVKKS